VGDFLTVKRLCTLSPKQGTSNIFPLFGLGFVLHRSHLSTCSTWAFPTSKRPFNFHPDFCVLVKFFTSSTIFDLNMRHRGRKPPKERLTMNVSCRNMLIRPLDRRILPGEVTYDDVLFDYSVFCWAAVVFLIRFYGTNVLLLYPQGLS